MSGQKTFVVLAVAAIFGVLGTSASANDMTGDRDQREGAVVPCSLAGINPAYHPAIFGNPAVAASYGFIRSADGTWHVRPGCHR
jgi:hypothetical protein